MKRIATGAFGVAIAAALLLADVAIACPTPPEDCADATELIVALKPPAVEAANHHFVVTVPPAPAKDPWCNSMALFTLDNLSVRLPGANGGPDVLLSDIRISRVVVLTTNQSAARYGSGAFCLWVAEKGQSFNQKYELTVVARDPEGNAHRGMVTVDTVCGAVSGTTFPTVEPKSCDPRCIAEVPPPVVDCSQCEPPPLDCTQCPPVVDCSQCEAPPVDCNQCPAPPVDCNQCPVDCNQCGEICCGPECPEDSYCPTAVNRDTHSINSGKLGNGGCSVFPGADSWLGILAMLGVSLALRRRN